MRRRENAMKARIYTYEFITISTIVSACAGAAPHWNEGDGCMTPAPLIGIGYAIFYGAAGLIVGALLALCFRRSE